MKYLNIILGLFVILLMGCAPAAQQGAPAEGAEAAPAAAGELPAVKIGVIAPLSGDVANLGADHRAGVALAVQEINAAGGINGRQVEAIYEDAKCGGKDATTAATKLIEVDKVQFIVGGLCSSETLAAAPLAEQAKVVMISPGSSNPSVSQAGDYIFRTWPSDTGQGKVIAEEMIKREHHKVAVILMNKDYNIGLANAFKENFEKMGGVITAWELYAEEEKDFRTPVAKARASKPDAIYLVSYPVDGGLIIKQIRQLRIDLPVYGTETLGTKDTVDAAGKENIEGMVYATAKFDPTWKRASEFLPKAQQVKGSDLTMPALSADAYDAVYLIAEALRTAPDQEPTGTIVKDYLYTVKNWEGAGGRLTFDEHGDPLKDFQIMIVHDGDFKKVSE